MQVKHPFFVPSQVLLRPSAEGIDFLPWNRKFTKHPARKIVAEGLAQVPEGRHVFAGLTVMENLGNGSFPSYKYQEENAALLEKSLLNVSHV